MAGKRVLIVDDSKSIIAMVQYSLEKAGYEVHTAYNGEEGLKRLEEMDGADLIVCDLNMPKLDGLSMLAKVKDSKFSSTPFVILTTEAHESFREKAKEVGAKAFIIKPFTEDQLKSVVKKFIK
jgi:two-component system chemotaxis response regulator CheY